MAASRPVELRQNGTDHHAKRGGERIPLAKPSAQTVPVVIPAQAGTHRRPIRVYDQEIHHVDGWVPAFAGMTQL